MKIGQPTDNTVASNAAAAQTLAKGGQSASASATATAVKSTQAAGVAVTVSTLARTLEASKRGEASDVDLEKVKSIRSSIEQGTYVVNPEAIADKLLSNAQEMLNRAKI